MRDSRRRFLIGATGGFLVAGGSPLRAFGQPPKGTRLVLLDTKGGPRVGGSRKNPSTLLVINDVPYRRLRPRHVPAAHGRGHCAEPPALRVSHPSALGPHARVRPPRIQRAGRRPPD